MDILKSIEHEQLEFTLELKKETKKESKFSKVL